MISIICRPVDASPTTRASGEDVTLRIDREGPNVCAGQTVVHRSPTVAVVGRSEDTTAEVESCEDLPTCIDRQRSNICCDDTLIDFDPALPVIRRSVDTATATDEISPGEDVAVRIGRQGTHVESQQTIVRLLPARAAIGRSKDPDSISAGKNVIALIDRYDPHVSRDQAMVL